MLSMRLSRVGTKKAPVYRIVVMPKHNDPWAKVTEILGHYNPRKQPRELVLKVDRVKHWLQMGAQPTDTVWNLLVDEKIVEGKKRTATHLTKKRRGKLEEKAAEAKAKAEEAAQKAKEAEEAAKAEAEAKAAAEAEEAAEAPAEEAKEETPAEEATEEAPASEDAPAEEAAPAESTEKAAE